MSNTQWFPISRVARSSLILDCCVWIRSPNDRLSFVNRLIWTRVKLWVERKLQFGWIFDKRWIRSCDASRDIHLPRCRIRFRRNSRGLNVRHWVYDPSYSRRTVHVTRHRRRIPVLFLFSKEKRKDERGARARLLRAAAPMAGSMSEVHRCKMSDTYLRSEDRLIFRVDLIAYLVISCPRGGTSATSIDDV